MATKHEADEVDDRVAGFNRIKTEPSGDDPDKCDVDSKEPIKTMSELESPTTSGIVEQVFVKTENDPDSGGTALPSIKSEPPGDEWDKCIAEDKSILEMEAENYKLDMEMSGQVKSELLIKKEWDDDPAAVYEVSASRIKEDADTLEAGPAGGLKQEADMDDEEYKLTEDCDIKSESDASMDAASDEPSNSMAKCTIPKKGYIHISKPDSDIHTCTLCLAPLKSRTLYAHMRTKHSALPSKNRKLITCVHCNTKFKDKRTLDNHVLKKHPNFADGITRKIYECTECSYKTVKKDKFVYHRQTHSDISKPGSDILTCTICLAPLKNERTLYAHMKMKHSAVPSKNQKLITCIHCDTKFTDKRTLDNHVLKKHPKFAHDVTREIYECTECSYKTVFKERLFVHRQTHSDSKVNPCIHCSATFSRKLRLDNHLVRKHPTFTKTFHRKIYECTVCMFRTVLRTSYSRHMSIHSASGPSESMECPHCNAKFNRKLSLDDHIVRKHPNFTKTIDREIHECTVCMYRTVLKSGFSRHMLTHSASGPSHSGYKDIHCPHCKAKFNKKQSLDDHIVKKHSNFIQSVSREIFQCENCTYKTVVKSMFLRHLSTHSKHVTILARLKGRPEGNSATN